MKLIEYPDREMMMIDLANVLAGEINACLMNHDQASFAVPGGTTPGPIFDTLSAVDLEWERVHVLPTDERWVPESDARSNARLIRERLLTDKAAAARFIPFYTDDADPDAAARALSEVVAPELPISVLLLGMGADMHTASLFPGADNLAEALDDSAPPVLAVRAPGASEPRITLTVPVLDGAMSKHIVITGRAKREALDRAADLPPLEAPVHAVWGGATVHWAE